MVSCLGMCFGTPAIRQENRRAIEEPKPEESNTAAVGGLTATEVQITKSETKKKNRRTALHLAAESGHLGVLQTLLETLLCNALASAEEGGEGDSRSSTSESGPGNGGDSQGLAFIQSVINARDSKHQTPLLIAAARGHSDCVRFLLSNGADRSRGDSKGNTPMHVASARGFLSIVLMLCTEYGEDADLRRNLDTPNAAGFTPLHHAVWGRQGAAVQILLQHGADMMSTNTRAAGDIVTCPPGTTPLHLAACRGHMEICRILLKSWLDRVVEPMMSQSSSEAATAAAIAALDPRNKANAAGQMAYQLAQRLGFFSLALLLRPNIHITRLFSAEERNVRFYGPQQLKAIAAQALNRHLVGSLDCIIKEQASNPATKESHSPLPTPAAVAPPSRPLSSRPPPLLLDQPVRDSVASVPDEALTPSYLGGNTPYPSVAIAGGLRTTNSLAASPSGRASIRISRSNSRQTTPASRSHLAIGSSSIGATSLEVGVSGVALVTDAHDSPDDEGSSPTAVASVMEDFEVPHLPVEISALPGALDSDLSAEPPSSDGDPSDVLTGDSWQPELERPASASSQLSLSPDTDLEYLVQNQTSLSRSRRRPGLPSEAGTPPRPSNLGGSRGVANQPRRSPLSVCNSPANTQDEAAAVAVEASVPSPPLGKDPQDPLAPGEGETQEHSAKAGETAAPPSADEEEEDEDECGVCLEHPAHVIIAPCQHSMCGPCARKICSMSPTKPSSCPFCRSLISSFRNKLNE